MGYLFQLLLLAVPCAAVLLAWWILAAESRRLRLQRLLLLVTALVGVAGVLYGVRFSAWATQGLIELLRLS